MEMPPEYRLLDRTSEMGEITKDAAKSTDYGDTPEEFDISSDEMGGRMYSLPSLSASVNDTASDPLDQALATDEQ